MSGDAPRLYLLTPPLTDAAAFTPLFEAALDAGDIACVLLRFDPRADAGAIAKKLVPLAQQRGAACLVGETQLAGRTGADGVHVAQPGDALESVLKAMKPKHIVGVGGLESRDDAMRAGESGIDYLMFGGPDAGLALPEVRERVAWWAEIFNVACVAYAGGLNEIAALVDSNADFVALENAVWTDARGPAAAVVEAIGLLAAGRDET